MTAGTEDPFPRNPHDLRLLSADQRENFDQLELRHRPRIRDVKSMTDEPGWSTARTQAVTRSFT